MVDMRVLGKLSDFAGDEASWKSWTCHVVLLCGSLDGHVGTVARCGNLVAQGAAVLASLTQDVPMNFIDVSSPTETTRGGASKEDCKVDSDKGFQVWVARSVDWRSLQPRSTRHQDQTRCCV